MYSSNSLLVSAGIELGTLRLLARDGDRRPSKGLSRIQRTSTQHCHNHLQAQRNHKLTVRELNRISSPACMKMIVKLQSFQAIPRISYFVDGFEAYMHNLSIDCSRISIDRSFIFSFFQRSIIKITLSTYLDISDYFPFYSITVGYLNILFLFVFVSYCITLTLP